MKFCIIKSKRVPLDFATPEDGSTINFVKLVKNLKQDNHEITVLTRNEQKANSYSERKVDNMKIIYLPFRQATTKEIMERDFEEGQSFTMSVNEYLYENNNFDVVHTHHWSSAINLKNRSIKFVHTPHLLAYAKMKYFGYKCPQRIIEAEKQTLDNCDKIIALSCREKNDILTQYNVESRKIIVIHNGINDCFRKTAKPKIINQVSVFKLATVAIINKQAGLDTLIKAVSFLKRKGIIVNLTIIGGEYSDGVYFSSITDLITNLNLQENVEIVGFIRQEKISLIYQQSDLYIQSSFCESQGKAVIEAMSCGLPIISTYHTALDEYLVEGENGFFYNRSDYGSLADKIQITFSNRKLYNLISKNNIEKSQKFTWENTYEKTLEVFDPDYNKKRNQLMLNKAIKIGEHLLSKQIISNLTISGSIAKKNTWSGSDIDFVAIKPNSEITEEFFFKDNSIENIYYISENYANKILQIKNLSKLAEYLYTKNIGEYLWNSIPIKKDNDLLNQIVKYVTNVRHKKEYIAALESIYFIEFQHQLEVTKNSIDNSSEYLAAISLRKAAFYFSMKFMIGKGWVVQGSKKRPERLIKFCKSDMEKSFYNLFMEINSLSGISLLDILKKTQTRHQLRLKYYNILVTVQEKNPLDEFINKEIKHNFSARNYYLENLQNGYELGALYHLRNLSSFPDFLWRYYFVQTHERIRNIDDLLNSKDLDSLVKSEWLQVMDLRIDKTKQWCSEMLEYDGI